jgi:hypothetical protein
VRFSAVFSARPSGAASPSRADCQREPRGQRRWRWKSAPQPPSAPPPTSFSAAAPPLSERGTSAGHRESEAVSFVRASAHARPLPLPLAAGRSGRRRAQRGAERSEGIGQHDSRLYRPPPQPGASEWPPLVRWQQLFRTGTGGASQMLGLNVLGRRSRLVRRRPRNALSAARRDGTGDAPASGSRITAPSGPPARQGLTLGSGQPAART